MSAKFPQGDSNMFRHILRKDNEFAHLLCQVTDVTALQQTYGLISLFI